MKESPVKKLSPSDRSALIRLASSLEKGSDERKAVLAGLKKTGKLDPKFEKALTAFAAVVQELRRRGEDLYKVSEGEWNRLEDEVYYARKDMGGKGLDPDDYEDTDEGYRLTSQAAFAEEVAATFDPRSSHGGKKAIQELLEITDQFGKWYSKVRKANEWIDDAIKRPGRLHQHFGIPEGEKIPVAKIDAEIAKLKKMEDRTKAEDSLLSALYLAKRLKKMAEDS